MQPCSEAEEASGSKSAPGGSDPTDDFRDKALAVMKGGQMRGASIIDPVAVSEVAEDFKYYCSTRV